MEGGGHFVVGVWVLGLDVVSSVLVQNLVSRVGYAVAVALLVPVPTLLFFPFLLWCAAGFLQPGMECRFGVSLIPLP